MTDEDCLCIFVPKRRTRDSFSVCELDSGLQGGESISYPDSCSASFLRQMISRVLLYCQQYVLFCSCLAIPYKVSYIDSTSAICSVKSVGSLSPFILYAAAIFLSSAYPIVHFQNRISLPKRRKSKGLFRTDLNKYTELTSIFI